MTRFTKLTVVLVPFILFYSCLGLLALTVVNYQVLNEGEYTFNVIAIVLGFSAWRWANYYVSQVRLELMINELFEKASLTSYEKVSFYIDPHNDRFVVYFDQQKVVHKQIKYLSVVYKYLRKTMATRYEMRSLKAPYQIEGKSTFKGVFDVFLFKLTNKALKV